MMLRTSLNILYDIIEPSYYTTLPLELTNLLQIPFMICSFKVLINLLYILSNNKSLRVEVSNIAKILKTSS